MSSLLGTRDWQEISRWIGPTLDQQAAYAIGAGTYNTTTFQVGSFESVTLICKPTGGTIVATFTSTLSDGPAGLQIVQTKSFVAGPVQFVTVPNVGDQVQVKLQGSLAGETIDFALVETNAGGALSSLQNLITGQVSAAGAIVAGSGFTVARAGLGDYTVTFNTPFAAMPAIVTQVVDAGAAGFIAVIQAASASSFRLRGISPTVGGADIGFNFLAQTML